MKKIIIPIILLVVIAVIGRHYYIKSKDTKRANTTQTVQENKPTSAAPQPTPTTETKSTVKTYTMEEVARHGSDPDNYVDCWTVIHDKVYDITKYVDSLKHPGGEQIYQACGTDATALFENRPGKGTPHPESARKILEKYYIGDLKK